MDSDDNNDDVILDANKTDEVHQDDNDNNACQPIVNGLLTFTISLVHNSTDVKITELLVKHFDGTEIKDAKCMLCDVAKVDYQIRQDSINRSEKVAHVRDIIERLRKLDKDNKLPLFVIDAVGLAKLPKINAEDICYVSVAEKIAQLSSKLDVLNDVVANNSVRSVKNEHDIQSMEKNYSKHVTNVSSNSNSALSMKCDADGISHMKKGPNSAPPGSTQGPHQGSDMGPSQGPLPRGPTQGPPMGLPQCPTHGPPQGLTQGPPPGPPRGATQDGPPRGPMRGPHQGSHPMKAVMHTGSKSLSSCQIPPLTSGPRVQLICDVNTSINSNAIIPAHTSTIDVGAGAISTRSATTVTSTTDSTASNALPPAGNTSIHNYVVPAGRSDATSDGLQLNADIELGQSMSGRDSHDDGQKSSYSNAVRNPHRWERPKQHVRSFERKNGRKRVHGTVSGGRIQGAPPPIRELFVSRVMRSTSDEDMLNYVKSLRVNIIDFERVSHDDSKYKSYKVTVSISDYMYLFDSELWPEGIYVGRYNQPRTENFYR